VAKKRATTEAAFSDLKMIQSIAKTMTRKPDIPERKGPVSLNADMRKTEIFRIMKENHRLLDRLETLEPIVSTTEMMRHNKERLRYTINVSHSKRLAGEYDDQSMKIRTEDKAKTDAMNRSVQARMTKYEKYKMNSSGSMSMPSLTPLAATDPGVLTTAKASPPPKPRAAKPVVTKPLGGSGGVASSSSSPAFANADADAAARGSKVSFSGSAAQEEEKRSDWQRKGGATPHPKKQGEMAYQDETPAARPAEVLPFAAFYGNFFRSAGPPDSLARSLFPRTEKAEDAAPAQEFDPGQSQPSPTQQTVGVAGSPPEADGGKAEDSYQDYEDDFAEETQGSMSKGKGMDESFEGSGAFESSKEG
jgi:hypothetical protein